MRSRKGVTLVDVIVLFSVAVLLIMILAPISFARRQQNLHLACAMNLKQFSNALYVYAFDYSDEFPVQGAGTHKWGTTTTGWDDPERRWKRTKGTVTVSSSLYLLLREADVGTKTFVCPSSGLKRFVNNTDQEIIDLWDFGPNPTAHLSYSYHYPYGKYSATNQSNSSNAVMADGNPWFDEKLKKSSIAKESEKTFSDKVSLIDPQDKTSWRQWIGNSRQHGFRKPRQGQNVLYVDGHVIFERRPDVGYKNDNIYTMIGGKGDKFRQGIAPLPDVINTNNVNDSVLVNDLKPKTKKKP